MAEKKIYVKYISLLVEENPYSASPFRCAWVEIFELFQHPQPDRRLALTILLVYHKQITTCQTEEYCQKWWFVNVFSLRTKNKISVLSEKRGSHNVKRGTGKARAVEMKHSCHLDTAEPDQIVPYTPEKMCSFSQKEQSAPLETNIKGEKDMCRHDLFLRPDQSRIVFHFLEL